MEKHNILVVNDNDSLREVYAMSLGSNGLYKICDAKDGFEGLNIIRSQNIEYLIVNFNMPSMNGLEMINTLKLKGHLLYQNGAIILESTAPRSTIMEEMRKKEIDETCVEIQAPEPNHERMKEIIYNYFAFNDKQ